MLLKSELKNFWLSSGIRKGDNILLHSNIKRTYFIFKKKHKNFKIDDYFESLIDIVLPKELLLFLHLILILIMVCYLTILIQNLKWVS